MTKDNRMSNIDWTAPIEGINGEPAEIVKHPHAQHTEWRDCYDVKVGGGIRTVNINGLPAKAFSGEAIVRNKAQPKADIPEWAIDKVRSITGLIEYDCLGNIAAVVNAFARYIMAKEEAPVDPAILKAREIAKPWLIYDSASIDAGYHDDMPAMQAVLEAIQYGRELERGEVK